jgi:hypothetical protein
MAIGGAGTADGDGIEQTTCQASSRQSFSFADSATGGLTVVNTRSRKCLSTPGYPGTRLEQWACDGAASQLFRVESLGGQRDRVVHVASGACVSASSAADRAPIVLVPCNGGDDQSWRVTVAP